MGGRGLTAERRWYLVYRMSIESSLGRVERRLLRDEAHHRLQDAIVRGELRPGQIIKDGELAAAVGLSRTPVREALARLTDEGLVESKPNAFTRVTTLTRRDCHEAFLVLRALHELAARTAADTFAEADARRMRTANAEFARAVQSGDVEAALAADDAVHAVPLQVADNRTLVAALERLTPRIRRLEQLRFGTGPAIESVQLHEQLVVALEAGDGDAAAAASAATWDTLGRLIEAAFAGEP